MANTNEFSDAGFSVLNTHTNENKLLDFLKENYPSVIRDNELNLDELKTVLGLPIDEKTNGYGLNFVGRNFAKAKYQKETEKELNLNTILSKDIDTTQNLVLKGDNLDSLKILKNHYSGKIKCIYIDPPYNTTSDEFVYPDKFNKEEAEVLGLANLSEDDLARMEFSFKSKKSHNGWLSFMYPRLLLAKDLLSKDGVIFISIDDNEQANLKLLCDDVFGEENFVGDFIRQSKIGGGSDSKFIVKEHEYLITFCKNINELQEFYVNFTEDYLKRYKEEDQNGKFFWDTFARPGLSSPIYYEIETPDGTVLKDGWVRSKKRFEEDYKNGEIKIFKKNNGDWSVQFKQRLNEAGKKPRSLAPDFGGNIQGKKDIADIFENDKIFSYPKPKQLLTQLLKFVNDKNAIILDFFAGSGTTGHATMQLNTEDGGNRKFILCQIDEPIKKDKPAYQFCIDNNLPTVISSITVERLRRAGEKIAKEMEAENTKNNASDANGLFNEGNDKNQQKQSVDVGFKVFDSVEATKLKVDEATNQIAIIKNDIDALSRIYNMIFKVGLDAPTQVPEMVVENYIYKIGTNYYFTNSEKINTKDFSDAVKSGKVFIDGWSASLNGTLQNYKEDVKIVF